MVQSMGPGTCHIPMDLYSLNRSRLLEQLRPKKLDKAVVVLQGGNEINLYDTEVRYPFRQESFFMWTFGVTEPGWYGIIEVDTGDAHLFIPPISNDSSRWRNPVRAPDHYKKKYNVQRAHYSDVLAEILHNLDPSVLLTLRGRNSETGLQLMEVSFPGQEGFVINSDILYPTMANLRVYKTFYEYEVMKYVIEVTCFAHKRVMRVAKPEKSEYLCESEFSNYIYGAAGCRFVAKTCACTSGKNNCYLDYGHPPSPNDNSIERGALCLFSMGASYFGYCCNVTCTFPAEGKFTPEQKLIYEAVLDVNREVIRHAKPGVSFVELHTIGNNVLLENLKRCGLLQGDVSKMMQVGLAAVFQPHGIGHFMGLDVYDVGGYLEGYPSKPQQDDGYRALKSARKLEEGMFISIGPGCYFIDVLLDRASNDPTVNCFLVEEGVKRFRQLGGVRIEECIYIHNLGCVIMSKVPRTTEQVEDWLAGIDDYDHLPSILEKKVSSVRFFN